MGCQAGQDRSQVEVGHDGRYLVVAVVMYHVGQGGQASS